MLDKFLNRFFGKRRHFLQKTKHAPGHKYITLGTAYGGWEFVDKPHLVGCTIISAGLDEDASFDVEFAKKYNARVIIVDPTPRAISHFNSLSKLIGNPSTAPYSLTGKQPVEAYDLENISRKNFTFVGKALWNKSTTLKFFEPADPNHVSHSIVNYQNGHSNTTKSIEVSATTLGGLLDELGVKPEDVPLVNLDIEGAEIEVITDFLGKGFRPDQILVEFDELNVPSERAFSRVDDVHAILEDAGYFCARTDGTADFLYLKI